MLSGDWWFLRQQRIPLSAHRIADNRVRWEQTSSRRRPETWTSDISLAEISEKAARFCFRLHSMQLAGVREMLTQLGARDASILTRQQQAEIRQRMDVPKGKQWSERLKTSLNRWTLDFNYKLGVLRGVGQPSPPLLDWAASMTWITMSQAETAGVTLPLRYVIYSCCAIALCSRMKPIGSLNSSATIAAKASGASITELRESGLPEWKATALCAADGYLTEPRMLLCESDRRQLQHLVCNEQSQFFSVAAEASREVRLRLLDWEVEL